MTIAATTTATSKKVVTRQYDLKELSKTALAELSTGLKSLFSKIWRYEIDETYLEVKSEKPDYCKMKLLFYKEEIVGFLILYGYRKKLNGKTIQLFKGTAGLLPDFRGNASLSQYFIQKISIFKLTHPQIETYFMDTPVHPSSYLSLMKNVALVYPDLNGFIPNQLNHVFESAKKSDFFPKNISFPFENPYLCQCLFNTFDSVEQTRSWEEKIKTDKYAQFFKEVGALEKDRGYLVISPVNWQNMLLSLAKTLAKGFRKMLKRKLNNINSHNVTTLTANRNR